MLRLTPSFIVAADIKKINVYGRFGFAIGVMNKIISETEIKNTDYNSERTYISRGGLQIGMEAATGFSFSLTKKLSGFAEICMLNMSYSPERSSYTKYTQNGEDRLSNMTVASRQHEYVSVITQEDNRDHSKPQKLFRSSLPASSVGLNFGIKLSI